METLTKQQLAIQAYKDKALYNWQYFPWGVMGWSIPCYGPAHSYLCTYLAKYGNGKEKLFLPQIPTMRELNRFTQDEDNSLAKSIYSYCERVYDYRKENRDSVASEVLRCIVQNSDFLKDFQEILLAKARLGYFD